jgi:hypothetical protein
MAQKDGENVEHTKQNRAHLFNLASISDISKRKCTQQNVPNSTRLTLYMYIWTVSNEQAKSTKLEAQPKFDTT